MSTGAPREKAHEPTLSAESSDASPEQSSGDYLDRLMRRDSFAALWPLFAKATKPAKELTESFSALVHLRPFLSANEPCRVIHVGDGAHARTAAMFALKTQAENISVDPIINTQIVSEWQQTYGIKRFAWRAARIEDVADELNALPSMRVLVTFVHAHVNTDRTLDLLRWDAAFCLACCVPGIQLTQSRALHSAGRDLQVLSPDRQFEVYTRAS
jgi:hypothetical protein